VLNKLSTGALIKNQIIRIALGRAYGKMEIQTHELSIFLNRKT
jgi:hypothetical protein